VVVWIIKSGVNRAIEMLSQRQKTCFFCRRQLQAKKAQTPASSADEHIVPDWLQAYLCIKSETVVPLLVRTKDFAPLDERRHHFAAFKAGGVCRGCNGGWMRELENQAKPILIALIEGARPFSTLTDLERFTVARWTLKTVAVLNRTSSYGNRGGSARPIPDEHLQELQTGGMPSDVLVVAAMRANPDKPFDFLQFASWQNPPNGLPLEEDHCRRSYKVALSFGQLILITAYYPSSDYAYGMNRKFCFEMWAKRRVIHFDDFWDDKPTSISLSLQLEVPMRNIYVFSHAWIAVVGNTLTTRLILS
jgi:hypothetical protein